MSAAGFNISGDLKLNLRASTRQDKTCTMDRCPGDNTFGPTLGPRVGGCYDFDFTLVFEESIFSIAPCALVIPAAIFRLRTLLNFSLLSQKNEQELGQFIQWPLARALKLVAYAVLACFQLALVLLWATDYGVKTQTTLASGILNLISTLALLALSDFEHRLSIRPSALLQGFWLMTILLDIARVRTNWFLKGNETVAAVFTAAFAVRNVLLVLELLPKWHHAKGSLEGIPPEKRLGLVGQTFFMWLNRLLLTGYRRDLTLHDLDNVDSGMRGDKLRERLRRSWDKVSRTSKHRLALACLRTFAPEIAAAFPPRIAFLGFSLSQPFLVNITLRYMANPLSTRSHGYGLIGAYALSYTGLAISRRWYMFTAFRTIVKLRGALVSTIYQAMLTIRAESTNSSSALSLMSTDVERVAMTSFHVVNVIPDLIHVALALWILGIQLGATAVSPVIVCLLCVVAAGYIGRLIPPRQKKWMAAIQKRVGITSNVVGSMKGVKVAGLSDRVEAQIQGLRDYELEQSTAFRKLTVMSILLGASPPLLLPAITFAVYAIVQQISGGSQIDVAKAFTAFSLMTLLILPIMMLSSAVPDLAAGMACLGRIQDFLVKEKRHDYRTLFKPPSPGSGSEHTDPPSGSDENEKTPWIRIRRGSFSWAKDASPVVKDIDLDIRPGELTLIVGPVASGKSTLLKAILGEAYLVSGSVEFTVPEALAYCDQDAWLLNQTIRNNILAFGEYDEAFYNKVVQACQLLPDLEQLPSGDRTMIGSKGISLSGGQKQRVALARAVYNRKPIVILDDILKGLDADTYAKCFAAIMGPEGLLRVSRTAIIMATHNVQLLPHAEHIVVLNEQGRITEKGTFDELNAAKGGYVNGLGLKKSSLQEAAATVTEEITEEEEERQAVFAKVESIKRAESAPTTNEKNGSSRGKRNKDALVSYLMSMGNVNFAIFSFFTVCSVGARTAGPLWLNVWASENERHANSRVGYFAGIYVLFGVLNVVFMAAEFWVFMVPIVAHSAKLLHKRILDAAMHAPMSFFVATDTGEIVNRFSQDMTLVDMQLPAAFMMTISMFMGAIAQIALTCVASGWFAISVVGLLTLLFFLQKIYLRTSRQIRLLDLEAKSPVYSFFISSFEGLTALRAYHWINQADTTHLQHLDTSQKPFYLLFCMQRWLSLVLDLIIAGMSVLLIGIVIPLREQINPGLLGVALTSVMSLGVSLSMMITSWTQLETSLGAITRINQFATQTPRDPDGPDTPPPTWPSHGAIEISHLAAKYGDQTALSDISVSIAPGQKIAICGRTGSGKSTLMMLLLRLYQPEVGSVLIDGVDTATLRLNTLREAMVALPQDAMFLAGSVRYNLDPAGGCSDGEILAALEKAGLRTVVEDKGGLDVDLDIDWLSAGQRQLFCLARAMLRRSRVLLLDEATSSLDRQTEDAVGELLRTEFAEWTVLVVAHRLQTILDFDRVLVLDEGRLVESGPPRELLEREGPFKTLCNAQLI